MVIAAAAAPAVINSATDNEGLINQAFKLTILIALLVFGIAAVYIIYQLTGFLGALIGLGTDIVEFADTGLGVVGTIGTIFLSIIPLGRPFGNLI